MGPQLRYFYPIHIQYGFNREQCHAWILKHTYGSHRDVASARKFIFGF